MLGSKIKMDDDDPRRSSRHQLNDPQSLHKALLYPIHPSWRLLIQGLVFSILFCPPASNYSRP